MYNDEFPDESSDMDVYLRYSDNNGATWTPRVRINDDATTRSQFLPKMSIDQTTGNIGFVWYDCRNDNGVIGQGSTNTIVNDDAQLWGTDSTNGGSSFLPNAQISAGTSNAAAAAN